MTELRLTRSEIREIVRDLNGRYIRLSRDAVFQSNLTRVIDCDDDGNLAASPVTFTATGETRGIVVTAGAGGGKSSLVRQGLTKHEALAMTETTMPLVSITVPSQSTLKSVGWEILEATGYKGNRGNRTAWQIWNDVRTRFQMLGTVVLWIDEAHDLFGHKQSEASDVLKTLKSLMQGEGAVVVVLSGIEDLWQKISFDDQVRRRYSRFDLPQMTNNADGPMLWQILAKYCDRASIVAPERGDLIERLIHAGRKNFGRCVEQMISAIEIALMEGHDRLTIQHFADAYFAQEGCSTRENVFLSPRWSSIDLTQRAAALAA